MNPRGAVVKQTLIATLLGCWCVSQDAWPFATVILALATAYVAWLLWRYTRPTSSGEVVTTFQEVRRTLGYRLDDHRAMGRQLAFSLAALVLVGVIVHALGVDQTLDSWDASSGAGIDELIFTLFVAATVIVLSSATDWYLILPQRDALTDQSHRYCADSSPEGLRKRRNLTKSWYRHRWVAMAAVVIAWVLGPSLLLAQRLQPAQQAGLAAALLTLMVAAAPTYLSQLSTLFAALLGQPKFLVGDLVTGKDGTEFANKTLLVHSVSADGLELVDTADTWLTREPTDKTRSPRTSPAIRPDFQFVDASAIHRPAQKGWRHSHPCRHTCMALPGECPWATENATAHSTAPA